MSSPVYDHYYLQLANAPLDPNVYALKDDEISFFQDQTGIKEPEELKKHILSIQADAYKVHPYPCIRRLAFTTLKISRYAVYEHVLELGKERPNAILLDLGCCFGNDARKAVADGFPASQVLASDLRPEYWELGHKLFRSSPENFPIHFIPGDVFDDNFLSPATSPSQDRPATTVDLTKLTSLNPLHHRIAAIHTSAFFHLFDEEEQKSLALRLGALLSHEPGSIIFGSHGGAKEPGVRPGGRKSFAHSPESWQELWDGVVFPKGSVVVEASLSPSQGPRLVNVIPQGLPPGTQGRFSMTWSVRRL